MMRIKINQKNSFRENRSLDPRKSALGGFTVIELLVSMSVFIILMGIITNIFINSLRIQRSLLALMAANDNISLAIEQMARDIRTGTGFCISGSSGSCLSPPFTRGQTIAFTRADSALVVYNFDTTGKFIEKSDDGGLTFFKITSNNVIVNQLEFRLIHDEITLGPADPWPPRITIALEIGSASQQLSGFFTNIQTTVSSRNIE